MITNPYPTDSGATRGSYVYFVSYTHSNSLGVYYGNQEITLPRPIRSIEDINRITVMLADSGVRNPVVLSFTRFEVEEGRR